MLLRYVNVCNFAATSDNSHYVKYITYSQSLDNVASKHIIREARTFGAVIEVRFEPRDAICSVVFAPSRPSRRASRSAARPARASAEDRDREGRHDHPSITS